MAQIADVQDAALKRVGEFADYDKEFDYHQALICDESFGTIAFCIEELQLIGKYGRVSEEVKGDVVESLDDLESALDTRATEVYEEMDRD